LEVANINVNELKPGVYVMYVITTDEKTAMLKLVKN